MSKYPKVNRILLHLLHAHYKRNDYITLQGVVESFSFILCLVLKHYTVWLVFFFRNAIELQSFYPRIELFPFEK